MRRESYRHLVQRYQKERQRSAFVFGHEEFGLRIDRNGFPGLRSLAIPNYGEVQSLNVSVAAGIVMYEYVRGRQPAAG